MKTSNSGFAGMILVIVVALVALGGGTYIYQRQKINAAPSKIISTPIMSTTSAATMPVLDDVATHPSASSWTQFSTTSIPVTFEYPAKWGNAEAELGFYRDSISFSNNQFLIEYGIIPDAEDNPTGVDLTAPAALGEGEIKLGKIITAGGKNGIVRYYKEFTLVHIPADRGNVLTLYGYDTDEDTLDTVLSSIRFNI